MRRCPHSRAISAPSSRKEDSQGSVLPHTIDLSFEYWRRVDAAGRESTARRLGKQLPSGFVFEAVRRFELGGARNEVAIFRQGTSLFALVPGGELTIGFDAARWRPEREERASWESSAEEYGLEGTIEEHVAEVTLRPRRIAHPPLLVETAASEVGWETISVDDPALDDPGFLEYLPQLGPGKTFKLCRGDSTTRVRRTQDGTLIADRAVSSTHADLATQLRSSGLRFPTSDEWEHLCGAGTATLFRWGDHVPCDRYPDCSPAESAWRREWVLSGGTLERPAGGFPPDLEDHLRPNAWGLSIASNPYKYELVAEPGTTRGGDGGCTICGGVGFFLGWLTLATAYFAEHDCRHDPDEPVMAGYTVGRRVLELS